MSDWNTRYNAAVEESTIARIEWDAAERALARANARRDKAEREMHRLFQERIDEPVALATHTGTSDLDAGG